MSSFNRCDLCKKEISHCGTPEFRRTRAYMTGDKTAATIVMRLIATIEGHPTGYGGPPDLCVNCVLEMIGAQLNK